jgi:hypothetical protein
VPRPKITVSPITSTITHHRACSGLKALIHKGLEEKKIMNSGHGNVYLEARNATKSYSVLHAFYTRSLRAYV